MKKGLRLAVASIAVLGLSLAAGGMALAQSSSGQVINSRKFNHSLKGTFSFRALDVYYGYAPSLGTLTFDGNGNVTGTMDLNDDGTVCQGTGLSGTYTVNPDRLTGTATLTLSSPACSSVNGVSLPLSLSLVRKGSGVVTVVNMVEMDDYTTGTFSKAVDAPFGAVAERSAR